MQMNLFTNDVVNDRDILQFTNTISKTDCFKRLDGFIAQGTLYDGTLCTISHESNGICCEDSGTSFGSI